MTLKKVQTDVNAARSGPEVQLALTPTGEHEQPQSFSPCGKRLVTSSTFIKTNIRAVEDG